MGDPRVNGMVGNRLRREKLQRDLLGLYVERERMIDEAKAAHMPESMYVEAVGRCYTEIEAAYVRQAKTQQSRAE